MSVEKRTREIEK